MDWEHNLTSAARKGRVGDHCITDRSYEQKKEYTSDTTQLASGMYHPSKPNAEWVSKGILSAFECFRCANKVDHRFEETNVCVLCRDPCKYRPLKGETTYHTIDDIEPYDLSSQETSNHSTDRSHRSREEKLN